MLLLCEKFCHKNKSHITLEPAAYFVGQWFLEPLGSLPQFSHSMVHFLSSCCFIEHFQNLSIQWTMIYIKIYFYFLLNGIYKIIMQLSALFAKYSAVKYCRNSNIFRGNYCLYLFIHATQEMKIRRKHFNYSQAVIWLKSEICVLIDLELSNWFFLGFRIGELNFNHQAKFILWNDPLPILSCKPRTWI